MDKKKKEKGEEIAMNGLNHSEAEDKKPDDKFPKAIPFIIGNEFCERFCYYGMRAGHSTTTLQQPQHGSSTTASTSAAAGAISATEHHHHTLNTGTTAHPTSSHSKSSTSSLPKSSATNSFSNGNPNNNNNNNNFPHHPTTLSTDDLLTSSAAANRLNRISGGAIPATDTLLNSIPIFPLDYDNLQPPKREDGGPTTVNFHVWVLSLDSIDEDSMTYVADIFMSQSWKDHRLNIPDTLVNTTSNYRLLPLSWLNYIWRPDSFFKNAKQVTFQEMTVPNHYLWMYEDKRILYMVKLTLLLSCSMKFQTYPHDTQQCKLQIESLSYTMDDLVFDWEKDTPLVVDSHIELPQHNLMDAKIGDCHNVYSSGNFTCVQVVFRFKRRLGYFIFHTYIPTCLIVIMSWISFWIKPEAVPARVTLCVTSLLTLSTQHAQSQKSLPPVSYIKAIDIFMSSCTMFVFSSLMEYLIINIVYLNHNNYADYSNSSNYNGNYYTGYSSNYLNAAYLNQEQQQHCKNSKCECNLSKRKLKKQIKKHLKQKQKSSWSLPKWFSSSSTMATTTTARTIGNKDRDNINNNNNDFSYPITNLNHFQQTPLSNGISTNNINQNVPTNSTSLTNLSPNRLKDNTTTNGGSVAVIAQTTNCGHCSAEDKRKQSKDSLCRKHVQCIQLASSNSHPTNVGLNSVITTTVEVGSSANTTTECCANLTSNLASNSTSSNQMPNNSNPVCSGCTAPKKIRPFKQCGKHNFNRNHDAQQPSSHFEYLNNEFRQTPQFGSGDFNPHIVFSKRDRAILVDKISRYTFPLSFIILNFIYWTFYLSD